MYNIEKIQEIMQQQGFINENDERTCWNLGAGLHIRFDDDMDEPGIVLSNTGRDIFSRKFTVEEIRAVLQVCALFNFNLLTEKVLDVYDSATVNNEVVGMLSLSDYEAMQEQIKTLNANLDSLAEDYNELLEERNQLHDSYKVAKENLERLSDENDNLRKQNRDIGNQYRRMEQDYQTYRRILNCIMSQFEAREIDW